MRILHVNDYRQRGGCEVSVATTIDLLRGRGHDVDLLAGDDLPRGPIAYVDSRVGRKRLGVKLDAWRPDVVHLHNFYHTWSPGILATLAGRRRRRPMRVVMTAHDGHLACPNSGLRCVVRGRREVVDHDRLRRLSYLLSRRWDERGLAYSSLKLAQHVWNYRMHDRRSVIDKVICPSRFMESILTRLALPTVYVANPTPQPDALPEKPAGRLQVVFAGRLDPEKGVAEFLRDLPLAFPGDILVVGDGAGRAAAEAVVAERRLADQVTFLGRRAHAETLEHIGAAHLCVLPSRVDENAPIALLEALAYGTNILVADRGGMREIVDASGVGYTFDPDDPSTLHQRFDEIVAAHQRGTLGGFDASAFLERHGADRFLEDVLRVYESR